MVRSAKRVKKEVERRMAARANRVVAVRHRLIRRSTKRKTSGSWSLSSTKNMSLSGLLFLCDAPYKIGDIIEIHVTMSGIVDLMNGFGQVVRIIERGPHAYDVAVNLVDLKPSKVSRKASSHAS